jgi:hypothetical protein
MSVASTRPAGPTRTEDRGHRLEALASLGGEVVEQVPSFTVRR